MARIATTLAILRCWNAGLFLLTVVVYGLIINKQQEDLTMLMALYTQIEPQKHDKTLTALSSSFNILFFALVRSSSFFLLIC